MADINLKGMGVALITPFKEDESVDYEALGKLVDYQVQNGTDYLVVLGTTAETPTLTEEEKKNIISLVVTRVRGRIPIVLGVGGNCTRSVVEKLKTDNFEGIDAILSVVPYYNKPSQEGIYQHYKAIAGVSPRPVVMYNIPGRTGVNMTAETTLRLARECKNIIAVKEASGNLSQMAYILRDRPEGFLVISGDDNLTLPLMAMGGDGVISVAVNAYPGKFCRMVHLLQQGDTAAAAGLHLEMMEATDALFAEGNPVGVKAALAYYGLIRNNLRLPLVRSSAVLNERLKELIGRYDLK